MTSLFWCQSYSEVRCQLCYKAANIAVFTPRTEQFLCVQHTGTCREKNLAASPTNSKSPECQKQATAWTARLHGDRVFTGRGQYHSQGKNALWRKKMSKKERDSERQTLTSHLHTVQKLKKIVEQRRNTGRGQSFLLFLLHFNAVGTWMNEWIKLC